MAFEQYKELMRLEELSAPQRKLEELQQKKQDKLERLGGRQDYQSLTDTHTVMPNGTLESNANKIWNDYSPEEKQAYVGDVVGQKALFNRDDGSFYQIDSNGNEVDFTGDKRRFYMYKTKDGAIKFGVARGDLPSSDYRYTPGSKPNYGWEGDVDLNEKILDVLLPYDEATALEAMLHGNKDTMQGRVYKDILSNEALDRPSGVSEIYKDVDSILGDSREATDLDGKYRSLADVAPKTSGYVPYEDRASLGIANYLSNRPPEFSIANVAKGTGSQAIQVGAGMTDMLLTGIAKGLNYAAKKVGKPELYTDRDVEVVSKFMDEYKDAEWANKVTGYDTSWVDQKLTNAVNEFDKGNYWGAAKEALKGGLETFTTSLPYMLSLVNVPGTTAMIATTFNNKIDTYTENNNGKGPNENQLYIMGMASAAEILLEKIAWGSALKGKSATLEAVENLLNTAPKGVKKELAKSLGKRALTLAGNAVEEGAQEGYQYISEYLTTEYGTAKDKGFNVQEMKKSIAGGVGAGGFAGTVGTLKGSTQLTQKPAQVKEEQDTTSGTLNNDSMDMWDKKTGNKVYVDTTTDGKVKFYTVKSGRTGLDENGNPIITEEKVPYIMNEDNITFDNPTKDTEETVENKEPLQEFAETVKDMADTTGASIEDTVNTSVDTAFESRRSEFETAEEFEAKKTQVKADVLERVRTFGMTQTALKEMTEDGVSFDTSESVKIVDKVNRKDTRTSLVDDSSLTELIRTKDVSAIASKITKDIGDTSSKVIKRVSSVLTRPSRRKALEAISNDIINNKEATSELAKLFNGSEGRALRAVTLGLKNVYSSIISEANVAKNVGVQSSKDGLNDTMLEGSASIASIAPQIGKDLLNSYGIKLRGSSAAINKQYHKYGMAVLKTLEKAGYINFNRNTVAPLPKGLVNPDNETVSDISNVEMVKKQDGSRKKSIGYRTTTITFNTKKIPDELENTVKALSSAMLPSNLETVKTEASEEVLTHDQRPLVPEEEDIIKRFNKLKSSIKPEFLELLRTLKNVYKENPNAELISTLLGTKYNPLDYFEDNVSGYNRNRKDKLKDIFDTLDELDSISEEGFNFSYMSAINHRIHVMETILDYQGDKFLSRNILTGGKYSTRNSVESNIVLQGLAEDLLGKNGTIEEILGGDTDSEVMKIMNSHIEAYNSKVAGENANLLYILNSKYFDNIPTKFQSQAFKWLELVRAISEVRDTYNGETLTTSTMTSFDATGSGATNTLLNLSGFPSVQNWLKLMNIKYKGKKSSEVLDPYKILETFSNMVLNVEGAKIPSFLKKQLNKSDLLSLNTDKINELQDMLNRTGTNNRDLAKYPIISWMYGEHISNTEKTMAKEVAKSLIERALDGNKEADKLISELTGKDGLPGKRASNLNTKDIEVLINSLRGYTKEYVKLLPLAFPEINRYRDFTSTVYNILTDVNSKWDYSVTTPFQLVNGLEAEDRYKMKVTKDKQVLEGVAEEGAPIISSKAMGNAISLSVNLQHALDAFQELMGLKAGMDATNDSDGVMAIHDDIRAKPSFLIEAKKAVEESFKTGALQYDFIDVLIREVENAFPNGIPDIHKKTLEEALSEFLGGMTLEQYQANKKEFLADVETDLFGQSIDKNVELPAKPTTAPTATLNHSDKETKFKTEMSELIDTNKYAYFDTETTWGGDNRIVQIGYIDKNGKSHSINIEYEGLTEEEYTGGKALGVEYMSFNEYQKLPNKVPLETAIRNFKNAVGDRVLVGFNNRGENSDNKWLKSAGLDTKLLDNSLDIRNKIQRFTLNNYVRGKLGELVTVFNVKPSSKKAHTADADAENLLNTVKAMSTAKDLSVLKDIPKAIKEISGKKEKPSKGSKLQEIVSIINDEETPINEKVEQLDSLLEEIKVLNLSPKYNTMIQTIQDNLATGRISKITIGKESHSKGTSITINVKKDELANAKHTLESMLETLGHEVEHAVNLAALETEMRKAPNEQDPNLRFILNKVVKALNTVNADNIPNKVVRDRIKYIQKSTHEELLKKEGKPLKENGLDIATLYQVAELMAIYRNEPDMAVEITKAITPKTISKNSVKKAFERLLKYIDSIINKIRNRELIVNVDATSRLNIKNIAGAIHNLGNVLNMQEEADVVAKEMRMTQTGRNQLFSALDRMNSIQNRFVAGIVYTGIGLGSALILPLAKIIHNKSMAGSTVYARTFITLDKEMKYNPFINKMKFWLRITDNYDEEVLNEVIQAGHELSRESNTLLTDVLPRLSKKLSSTLNNYGMKLVNKIFSRTDFASLVSSELYKEVMDGKKTLKRAIKELESRFSEEQIAIAKDAANYYVNGVVGEVINLDTKGYQDLRELASFYAMNMLPNSIEMLHKLRSEESYLYKKLVEYSIAVGSQKMAINLTGTTSDIVYTDFDGTGTMDVFDKAYDFEVVTKEQMQSSKYSKENGWEVVREPKGNILGVVAREKIGDEFTPGIGLNSNRFYNGIVLTREETLKYSKMFNGNKELLKKNNIVEMSDGRYRVVLTTKEKTEKLALKEDIAHSLVRTYVHNKEVLDMNKVRELVLEKATLNATTADIEELGKKDVLKEEMPLFIKLPDSYKSFDDLPVNLRRYYKTPEGISNYNNFSSEISLVRRDMADTLLGYKNARLFGPESNVTLQKAEVAFKRLILMMKLKLAIYNPVKLAIDTVSNTMYLLGRGVGVDEIYTFGKEGTDEYIEYTKLQTLLVKAKFLNSVNPTNANQNRIKILEKRMQRNGFSKGAKYGFIQSYSTELLVKDFDSISGLQKDIEDIIKKVAREDSGELNGIGKAFDMWMNLGARYGLTVDSFLRTAVAMSKSNKTTVGKSILELADRLKNVRSKKDVEQYITNIVGGPNSEGIKYGSAFMVGQDAISKYILANSLLRRINPNTGKKYTEAEAYLEAGKGFLDQRHNMPQEIKALSDFGILMFPSFWARITPVIINLFKTNPVNAVSMGVMGEMASQGLNVNGTTILDSNALTKFNKFMEFGSIGTNPIQFGTVLPIGF